MQEVCEINAHFCKAACFHISTLISGARGRGHVRCNELINVGVYFANTGRKYFMHEKHSNRHLFLLRLTSRETKQDVVNHPASFWLKCRPLLARLFARMAARSSSLSFARICCVRALTIFTNSSCKKPQNTRTVSPAGRKF